MYNKLSPGIKFLMWSLLLAMNIFNLVDFCFPEFGFFNGFMPIWGILTSSVMFFDASLKYVLNHFIIHQIMESKGKKNE